jgi:hypothetical protein
MPRFELKARTLASRVIGMPNYCRYTVVIIGYLERLCGGAQNKSKSSRTLVWATA